MSWLDEIYDDAVRFAMSRGYCTVSMFQRQFRIGYTHAMELIEQLEKNGILAPLNGGRREVLHERKTKNVRS